MISKALLIEVVILLAALASLYQVLDMLWMIISPLIG